ncbi:MAG: hypothetical protein IPM13_18970, partial [Phycisphaerales bacterium]|nr:hypothetical protein [Phycisphaerales bacterium]
MLVRERGASVEPGEEAAADGGRTRLLGGSGGSAFEERLDPAARLIGFRYTIGEYFGHRVLASIQPLFRIEGRVEAARTFGQPRGEPMEITAGEGFEVIGLEARSGDVFDG